MCDTKVGHRDELEAKLERMETSSVATTRVSVDTRNSSVFMTRSKTNP